MRSAYLLLVIIFSALCILGCKVSKPYIMETDRADQGVSGNRGYIKGNPPPAEAHSDKRRLIAVDIDFPKIGPKDKDEETK